ncbi:MAG TPA: CopG family antitoxin [Syntrophothermus lipocalidus]|nr:CopG family antitoxin [Syntrophothermus lipocalidus]
MVAERRKTKRITLRLRECQLEAVKRIAEKKDIPYQTLIRSWVAEAIRREEEKET